MSRKALPILNDNDIEQYDRIDKYIMGKMSKEEELKFIEDCKKDKELKEKAISVALIAKTAMKHKHA